MISLHAPGYRGSLHGVFISSNLHAIETIMPRPDHQPGLLPTRRKPQTASVVIGSMWLLLSPASTVSFYPFSRSRSLAQYCSRVSGALASPGTLLEFHSHYHLEVLEHPIWVRNLGVRQQTSQDYKRRTSNYVWSDAACDMPFQEEQSLLIEVTDQICTVPCQFFSDS